MDDKNRAKINFGILGTGNIAKKFAASLAALPGAALYAVGSRNSGTAREFGLERGIPPERCFGGYGELCACPGVDVVYVASPHSHHLEHMLLAVSEKKNILCEKAFTLTAAQAREAAGAAKAAGVYLCEAMWTRFLPSMREIKRLVFSGEIGEVNMALGVLGVHFSDGWPLSHRIYDPALGGGALLDLGVYPVSILSMAAGDEKPEQISCLGRIFAPTGADEHSSAALLYSGGRVFTAITSMKTEIPTSLRISGSKGEIFAPGFLNPERFTLKTPAGVREISVPAEYPPYACEALAVMEDIRAGRSESGIMPLAATLNIMEILDFCRHSIGCYYPCEQGVPRED